MRTKLHSKSYEYIAIWEESFIVFDSNSKNFLFYIVMTNVNKSQKYIKKIAINYQKVFEKLSLYETGGNEDVLNVIITI